MARKRPGEMDVEMELRKVAKNLLRRSPLRRGPYVFREQELKKASRKKIPIAKGF